MSTIDNEVLTHRFSKIRYLIGDFNVKMYRSSASGEWIQAGNGSAGYRLTANFITEKIELLHGSRRILMHNTLGCDSKKDAFRLFTLDMNLGVMDVFEGTVSEDILIFTNLESGIKTKTSYGEYFAFKLIYKQLSERNNELIIGCSKDNGKTWFPFLKNCYERK